MSHTYEVGTQFLGSSGITHRFIIVDGDLFEYDQDGWQRYNNFKKV
jgi:hypothetical protein